MSEIFTDEHKNYINKQISKALKNVDYEKIVKEAIEREFEDIYESCVLRSSIKDMVTEVIHEHLVKSGLLKGNE